MKKRSYRGLQEDLAAANHEVRDYMNQVEVYRDRANNAENRARELISNARQQAKEEIEMIPLSMRLTCPSCGALHVDAGAFATKPHHTHACQACGMVWRPAVRPTVGVRFLPGFKNKEVTDV